MSKFGVALCLLALTFSACQKEPAAAVSAVSAGTTRSSGEAVAGQENYKVTFIELGSVRCIPCRMMQPIMRQVEEKFKGQVRVVFYDVWTEKDAPMAERHRIKVIPTQVFLDASGREYYRHEGYFPYEELLKVLKMKGVE
jgi:thioredoxin 1